jgi:hypothetical protein
LDVEEEYYGVVVVVVLLVLLVLAFVSFCDYKIQSKHFIRKYNNWELQSWPKVTS